MRDWNKHDKMQWPTGFGWMAGAILALNVAIWGAIIYVAFALLPHVIDLIKRVGT